MIIEKLGVESFGALKGKELSFDRAINVIEGPNESGKSSIAAFICFIFYGFDGAPDEQARYTNGGKESVGGWLELSCDKGRFRVKRRQNCGGKGPDAEVSITDLASGAQIRGNDPARLFLGVDRALFERSCFMAQLKNREITGAELSCAIENMLSSANESINAGKGSERLYQRLTVLEGEDGKGGLILENALISKDLEKRIEQALADEEEEKRLVESLNDHKKKLAANRRENGECQKLYDHAERRKKLERLKTAGIAMKRKNAAQQKINELRAAHTENGFCPDSVYLRQIYDLNELVKKASENERRALEAKAKAAEAYASLTEPPKGKKSRLFDAIESCRMRRQQSKNIFFFCLGIAVLLLIVSVFLFIFSDTVMWGIIGVCAAIASFGVGGLFLSRANAARQEEARLYKSVGVSGKEELSEALEKYAEQNAERASLEKQIAEYGQRAERERDLKNKLLEKASVPAAVWGKTVKDENELDELFSQAQSVVSDILRAEDERGKADEILRASGETFTEEELRSLLEKQKNDGVNKELTDEEYKNVQMKLRFYAQTIEGLQKRIETQTSQLSVLRAKAEDSDELREKYDACRAEGEKLREEAFVVRSAREALNETIEHMRSAILPAVLHEASDFLVQATAGKYTGFEVGEGFALRVIANGCGSFAVSELSGGTAELCYVALRLGVSGRLYGEPAMPYLFDESFAHFDDLRKVSSFMAISNLAKAGKGQFFILTCRKRDTSLFEKICAVNKIEL